MKLEECHDIISKYFPEATVYNYPNCPGYYLGTCGLFTCEIGKHGFIIRGVSRIYYDKADERFHPNEQFWTICRIIETKDELIKKCGELRKYYINVIRSSKIEKINNSGKEFE